MNTTAAFPVSDPSQVSGVRRAAQLLADRLEFSSSGSGSIALAVTELATNLARHTRGGQILMRALGPTAAGDEPAGLEVLAIDAGPGIRDEGWSLGDGHSTAGSLGHGLGTVERQAHTFQIYTQPSGTVVLARFWRGTPPPASRPLHEIGSILVSKPGEDICGDDMGWRSRPDRFSLMLADGLGHGLQAHAAARAAVRAFEEGVERTPEEVIRAIHGALRDTRGAAVACLAVDTARGVARYCGLGNISAVIAMSPGKRHSLVSQNGTAGHTAPRIQEFTYPIPRQSVVVLHTDGLSGRWDLDGYPGLRTRHPGIIAGVLYRDFARKRDDVAVAVVKEREGVAG
jgi:anti-sigma regulatory factor (Ser/Thr protein kinase)